MFAIELAFVIEEYGDGSEEDAKAILDLYLNGANSIMLAASYAQRDTAHGSELWDTLIQFCLDAGATNRDDGSLFGSLLESAALCGADLSLLVTRIPEGMNVEGLRPKLVAAVGDYRLKLKMHEAATGIGEKEKIGMLRELGHRSRRGTRFYGAQKAPKAELVSPTVPEAVDATMPPRPLKRPTRYRFRVGVPMR